MLNVNLAKDVRAAIEATISPIPVNDVTIVEGQNFEGENVLYVTLSLPSGTEPIVGPTYVRVLSAVSQALMRWGEERIPLFLTRREGEDDPIESDVVSRV